MLSVDRISSILVLLITKLRSEKTISFYKLFYILLTYNLIFYKNVLVPLINRLSVMPIKNITDSLLYNYK